MFKSGKEISFTSFIVEMCILTAEDVDDVILDKKNYFFPVIYVLIIQ